MSTLVEQAVEKWKRDGASPRAPAVLGDFDALEQFLGRSLPNDIRALYLCADGMSDSSSDRHLVSFWSLSRIIHEREVTTGSDERGQYTDVAFADVLISSWYFWLRIRSNGHWSVFVEVTKEELSTFGEFLSLYVADPDRLCL